MPPPNNNPYASAAGAYSSSAQKHTPDQRELEANVLLKSARFMEDLQKDWDNVTSDILEETLKYNRRIWMLFYDNAIEDTDEKRTNDLRSNIASLATFIFKREMEIMGKPDKQKLDVLININREIAAGLSASQKNNPAPEQNTGAASALADIKEPPVGGGTSTSA